MTTRFADTDGSISSPTSNVKSSVNREGSSFSSTSPTRKVKPDFNEIQKQYTKQLLHGRHPRSFPRQTELWHHYDSSTERLERVTKGHNLWDVINSNNCADDDGIHNEQSASDQAQADAQKNNSSLKSKGKHQTELFHGLLVDMKSKVRLHYTMQVVIVNHQGQYLCIHEKKEDKAKSLHFLSKYEEKDDGKEKEEKRVFEIQCKPPDLLQKDDYICFKLLDLSDPLNPGPIDYGRPLWLQVVDPVADDTSWQQGSVVAVKLFDPPEMASIPLEQVGVRDRGEHRGGHSHGHGPSHGTSAARSKDRKDDGKASLETRHQKVSSGSMTQDPQLPSLSPNRSESGERIQKKVFEEPVICGGVNAAKIAIGHWTKDSAERFAKSKQASQLGQFVAHCALRNPDADDPMYLNSQVPVILGQDLYSLATSRGSTYLPWPRIASNTAPSHKSALDSKSGGSGHQDEVADGFNYACMRRTVMRDLPYEHIVDRRCVWKFCVVDNSNDFKSMSSKEQRAQKLLKKARKGLNRSRRFRMGGRVHDGLSLEGRPLVSGEGFAQTLREISSESTLKIETKCLDNRRKKEEHIGNHFKNLYNRYVTKIETELGPHYYHFDSDEDDEDSIDESVSASSLSKSLSAASITHDEKPVISPGSHHAVNTALGVNFAMDRSPHSRSPTMRTLTATLARKHSMSPIHRSGSHHQHTSKSHGNPHSTNSTAPSSRRESGSLQTQSAFDGSEGDSLVSTHELLSEGRQYALTQLQPRAANSRVQELPAVSQKRLEKLLEMDRKVQQALSFRSREFQARHIASTIFNGDAQS